MTRTTPPFRADHRATWHMDFIYQLGGIEHAPGDTKVQFRNEQGTVEWTPAAIRVAEKIHLDHTIFAEAFEFLKSTVNGGATPKLTIPSPNMVHYRGGRLAVDERIYPDMEEFWSDLSATYADEIRALEGKPEGMAVTTHLCRGNFRSSWAAEGSYDFVGEALFGGLGVDGFFLEYDDARSGGFEPLRFVPSGKQVVLGLVTTKHGELESKDLLKRRIEEASRYVPIDQLCLSPQCGFSSTVDGNVLTRGQEIAKLELIVETATEVWGD